MLAFRGVKLIMLVIRVNSISVPATRPTYLHMILTDWWVLDPTHMFLLKMSELFYLTSSVVAGSKHVNVHLYSMEYNN